MSAFKFTSHDGVEVKTKHGIRHGYILKVPIVPSGSYIVATSRELIKAKASQMKPGQPYNYDVAEIEGQVEDGKFTVKQVMDLYRKYKASHGADIGVEAVEWLLDGWGWVHEDDGAVYFEITNARSRGPFVLDTKPGKSPKYRLASVSWDEGTGEQRTEKTVVVGDYITCCKRWYSARSGCHALQTNSADVAIRNYAGGGPIYRRPGESIGQALERICKRRNKRIRDEVKKTGWTDLAGD